MWNTIICLEMAIGATSFSYIIEFDSKVFTLMTSLLEDKKPCKKLRGKLDLNINKNFQVRIIKQRFFFIPTTFSTFIFKPYLNAFFISY